MAKKRRIGMGPEKVRTKNGIELTPFDPDFAEALDDAQAFMRKYPNAMKALAE
jgi:hypothetical protein